MASSAQANVSTAGFPVFGILGLVFVLAKVFEIGPIAAWSWWWILAPFWIGFAIFLAVMVVVALFAIVIAALDR